MTSIGSITGPTEQLIAGLEKRLAAIIAGISSLDHMSAYIAVGQQQNRLDLALIDQRVEHHMIVAFDHLEHSGMVAILGPIARRVVQTGLEVGDDDARTLVHLLDVLADERVHDALVVVRAANERGEQGANALLDSQRPFGQARLNVHADWTTRWVLELALLAIAFFLFCLNTNSLIIFQFQ